MREVPIPADATERDKILRAYQRKNATYSVFFYIFLALSVACFLATIVTVIVFEFNEKMHGTLCCILLGAFLGGGIATALLAFLFSRLLTAADRERLDFSERCDSEYSFYVGEGTLATFEADSLLLHGDNGGSKTVRIPYAEVRVFSVCTRRAPREKGEWSVALELPARDLVRSGKAENDEKILVQTDAKERLYRVISERGLPLLGEDISPRKNRRYVRKTKFFVPIPDKRRKYLIMTIFGFAIAAAGIPTAIYWNITVGSFLSVIGLFMGMRCLSSFLSAKSVFSVYEEGIFWKDAAGERMFLKWEEIDRIVRNKLQSTPVLTVRCIYGDYHLPDIAGVYEYLSETQPDKCEK